jgi:hypothetical protein
MIYYGLFQPIITYGIEFWGASSNSKSIFKIQKKYIRIMTFSSKRKSCKSFFKEYGILTVPSIYILRCLLFVENNYEKLIKQQHQHQYLTRFNNNFQYPRHRLTLAQKTPQYMGRKLFNKLPTFLKDSIMEDSFKNNLKTFLIEQAYYSIDEFLE